MKQPILVVVIIGVLFLGACGGPPTPQAPPPPPAAPGAPPPAPTPTDSGVAALENDYDKLLNTPTIELDRMGLLGDVRYAYDRAELRPGDRAILAQNADVLKKFDFLKVTVEGHCDERGSVEYNLALGERRAKAAYDYLIALGVEPSRLRTVSYGKEVPVCSDQNESCWARNRRAHFAITGKTR